MEVWIEIGGRLPFGDRQSVAKSEIRMKWKWTFSVSISECECESKSDVRLEGLFESDT